jgi:hypothetical protein
MNRLIVRTSAAVLVMKLKLNQSERKKLNQPNQEAHQKECRATFFLIVHIIYRSRFAAGSSGRNSRHHRRVRHESESGLEHGYAFTMSHVFQIQRVHLCRSGGDDKGLIVPHCHRCVCAGRHARNDLEFVDQRPRFECVDLELSGLQPHQKQLTMDLFKGKGALARFKSSYV